MRFNINKKIISFVGIFLFVFSLSFCVLGEKAFAQTKVLNCNSLNNIQDNTDNKIKILFDGDKTISSIKYKKYISTVINSIKTNDPFKKYFDRFSFYDVNGCDIISTLKEPIIKIYFFIGELGECSTCRFSSINLNVGHHFESLKDDDSMFDALLSGVLSFNSIHELGHAIGKLNDEYKDPDSFVGLFRPFFLGFTNCSKKENKESVYKSSLTNLLYGLTDIKGCYYREDDTYFRPSMDSMMNGNMSLTTKPKFNVISCGYLIAGIKGESPTKSNAEKYWPECCALDTVKDGVEGCNPQQKTIIFPPEKRCEETTFTNILERTPYDTDMKISSSEDISLLTIDGDNFFKINGKDVSVPDGTDGRKIPEGDLIIIPANTEINIETGDKTCREYDITLSLQEEYTDLQSPFECFSNC